MSREAPLNGAGQPEVPPPNGPQNGLSTEEEGAQRTVAALSWQALRKRFEPRVEGEGFDTLPEPDGSEFPYFLADLNAVNPSLARELVQETRRLRRELALPSPRASRRRERHRATRRFLFMRRTPDGRWVYDKAKAPLYGMGALLLVGGLLTAVYALPRLNGKPALTAHAATPPTGKAESAEVLPPAGEAQSEAALRKSREDLARFRREQAAREAAERAAPRGPTSTGSGSVAKSKPLAGSEPNPPAPPAIPPRSVQTPTTPAPAVFAPVPPSSPAPQAVSTPPPAPAPPPARVTPPVTYTPEPARAAPAPTRSTAEGTAARTPAVTPPETADVSAAFGALPVVPPPVDTSPVVASSQDAATAPTGSAAFGDVPESASIPDAAPEASSPGFTSGLVYERASQPATASVTASGALPAETPFGSAVTNPASQIGATGPFTPLQQVPATLLMAISALGGASVPAVAVTQGGGSFTGVGTINATLARVDITFRRYVAPDGKVEAVDALAYARESNGLTQGLHAEIRPVAPTLALDAAQNSANALNTFVQNAASAAAKGGQGTSVNIGDNLTISGPTAASLAQTLLGGLGSTFRMPENAQSISRIARVDGGTPMTVIVGLGGEGR